MPCVYVDASSLQTLQQTRNEQNLLSESTATFPPHLDNIEASYIKTQSLLLSEVYLTNKTCASCSISVPCVSDKKLSIHKHDFSKIPHLNKLEANTNDNHKHVYETDALNGLVLDKKGVMCASKYQAELWICTKCHKSLSAKKTPPLSLANGFFTGPLHNLPELTWIEKICISKYR